RRSLRGKALGPSMGRVRPREGDFLLDQELSHRARRQRAGRAVSQIRVLRSHLHLAAVGPGLVASAGKLLDSLSWTAPFFSRQRSRSGETGVGKCAMRSAVSGAWKPI